jgi:hypothetical protein
MRSARGSVTLMVLVLLIVFLTILGASIRYIARQSKQTTDQGQQDQAFGLADAGVQYTYWLLNEGKAPSEISTTPGTTGHTITASGVELGSFTINVVAFDDSVGTLSILSVGEDNLRPEFCQAVRANFELENDIYRVAEWRHETGYVCEQPAGQGAGGGPQVLALNQIVSSTLQSQQQYEIIVDEEGGVTTPVVRVSSADFTTFITVQPPTGDPITTTPGQCGPTISCSTISLNLVEVGTYSITISGGSETEGAYTLYYDIACSDGANNNDGDSNIDYPADNGCTSESDDQE